MLLVRSNGAHVDFIVVVCVCLCGVDDLLLDEILCVRAGDISEDAEFVDARLTVISPSVLPNVVGGGVIVCVCVCEAAARTNVRRLSFRFPKPVCARGSHCSSEALHNACTGWAVAVFQLYRPVFATGGSAGLRGSVRPVCIAVSVAVAIALVVVFLPVCNLICSRSGEGQRMSRDFADVCVCGTHLALIRLSY